MADEQFRIGGFTLTVRTAPPGALPEGHMLLLPGPRDVIEVEQPDGSVMRRGETLAEYARRCVLIRFGKPAAG